MQGPAPTSALKRERQALMVGIALILVWGANFSVQKAIYASLSPSGFLFARYLMMPACALALLLYTYGTRLPSVSRRDLLELTKLGIFGHVLHVAFVAHGMAWSTAFSSSLILASGPIFTLLILRWSGIERLTRSQIAGMAVAGLGALVFLSDKLAAGRWAASGGDLFLLAGACLFSYYTVSAKPLIERHGGIVVMTYATLLGSVPAIALSLPIGLGIDWGRLSPLVWMQLLWSVLVSAFVGWLAWGWVNAVRGVARTAPLMYLMPPVAGAIAWIVADERFTTAKLVGATITLAGVALAQFPGRSRARGVPGRID